MARTARVSRQALYLHFRDRSALFLAVAQHADDKRGLPEVIRRVQQAPTGLDALRATGNDTGGTGTGVLIGTLLAALGALLVLAFVFRSFTAVIPLLMAVVAIPTTSGTGSEVTPFAVVTDDATGKKYPIADYSLTPDMALEIPQSPERV